MAEPLGLVGVLLQVHARNKGFIASHNDHDEEVGDHHHVNQAQNDQHDDGLGELGRHAFGFVPYAAYQRLQSSLTAKHGL